MVSQSRQTDRHTQASHSSLLHIPFCRSLHLDPPEGEVSLGDGISGAIDSSWKYSRVIHRHRPCCLDALVRGLIGCGGRIKGPRRALVHIPSCRNDSLRAVSAHKEAEHTWVMQFHMKIQKTNNLCERKQNWEQEFKIILIKILSEIMEIIINLKQEWGHMKKL